MAVNFSAEAEVERGPEGWQFLAFMFGSFAALGLAIISDFSIRLSLKILLQASCFILFFYLFMRNSWFRDKLIRFLLWIKKEQ
jgi:hypothetical protein